MMPILSVLLIGTVAEAGRGDRRDVETTLRAWVDATDARDADAVARVFMPDAVQRVRVGAKEMALTTQVYVSMIRDGKIGGGSTTLAIHDVEVTDALATALTTRTSGEIVMHDALILERTTEGWRVASASVHATPR